jgi:hypothetical protein
VHLFLLTKDEARLSTDGYFHCAARIFADTKALQFKEQSGLHTGNLSLLGSKKQRLPHLDLSFLRPEVEGDFQP